MAATSWQIGAFGLSFLRMTFAGAMTLSTCLALAGQQEPKNYSDKDLEDLMNMEVTSASKKSENLSGAPAAIFVLTGADIRRGGFTSIPDALRSVPGMYVTQQTAHIWQVSARGFSSLFNSKMLVLVDGRVVYTPSFGGVWWDVQDAPLEDIDRIEVIRGPGGTLWGANAVNGVINIITKDSAKTQGPLITTSAGFNEGYGARVRYGGTIGNAAYRIYGTSNYWLPSVDAGGRDNYDEWTISQGGFRTDWSITKKDSLSIDGEGYSGRARDLATQFSASAPPEEVPSEFTIKGGHVLGRWKHTFSDRSSAEVLGYCDWTSRSFQLSLDERNICDIDFQHNHSFSSRHSLTWGGSILTTQGSSQVTFRSGFVPALRTTTYAGFLQYELVLAPDKLRIIAGTKLEHNDLTGFEYQPQIRAVWTPDRSQSLWVAVSRAVRTPTLSEKYIQARLAQVSLTPPTFLTAVADPDAQSELLHAYELGYRYQWKKNVSFDGTIFYNGYDQLFALQGPGTPIIHPSPFFVDLPFTYSNSGGGQTHGAEFYVKYVVARMWIVSGSISELRGDSPTNSIVPATADNPRHIANLQSRLDLPNKITFDANYYYVDAIHSTLGTVNRIDLGLSKTFAHGFSVSLWGRNLQQERHQEAVPFLFPVGEIRRSLTLRLLWEP